MRCVLPGEVVVAVWTSTKGPRHPRSMGVFVDAARWTYAYDCKARSSMHQHNEIGSDTVSVSTGRHQIGPNHPVFVVAEAGVNHDGALHKALDLIDRAVEAGADAVKFQMFRARELATATAQKAAYQARDRGGESQLDMLSGLELSEEAFAAIRKHCDERGVVFLATPFGPADVTRLASLQVAALKVASTDLTNEPLLDAAVQTGLPLILSTGASTEEEIKRCVDARAHQGALDRLILMHCVSAYPTPLDAINLRTIATLRQAFRVPCGLSDHTTSVETGAWAVAAGACVIEKHLTYDRRTAGPDHAMSLDPGQLGEYVARIRLVERSMGNGRLGMSPLEADVREVARKSVVSAKPISVGTVLTDAMLTLLIRELCNAVDECEGVDSGGPVAFGGSCGVLERLKDLGLR